MENRVKILVVDDDESVRSMYSEVFRGEGLEVEEAVDGLEGLDRATKNIPDIIFTGIVMPRMDGFGFMEALGKNTATAKIPVFVNSHMGREEDRKRASDLGARAFFVKGMVTPKEVVERIKVLFGESAKGYKIKFSPVDLDAPELAQDLHFGEKFQCRECGTDLALDLQATDISEHEFSARFVCPACGK